MLGITSTFPMDWWKGSLEGRMSSKISERSEWLPQVWEIGDALIVGSDSRDNIGLPKVTETSRPRKKN